MIQVNNKDDREFVKKQVLYLSGAFPNLNWDINISTASWLATLTQNKITKDELKSACEKVISGGFQDWEINISLICEIILNRRERDKRIRDTQKILEEINSKPQMDTEKFRELRKQYGI